MNVAKKIKEIREKQGISKNRLSQLSGVSQSYIGDIEAGKKNPTIDKLEQLCSGLGVTVVQILQEDNATPLQLQLMNRISTLSSAEIKLVLQFIELLKRRDDSNE